MNLEHPKSIYLKLVQAFQVDIYEHRYNTDEVMFPSIPCKLELLLRGIAPP